MFIRRTGERRCPALIDVSITMTAFPFALSLSKGMSEWAQGFDKLSPNGD
jgi:hypothetical protein